MKQVPRDEVSILCTQARNDRKQLSDHLQESRVELSDLSADAPPGCATKIVLATADRIG